MEPSLLTMADADRGAQLVRCGIRIGGISLGLTADASETGPFGCELRSFLCEAGNGDIEVSVKWVDSLDPLSRAPDFDSSAVWRLFSSGDELIFDFTSGAFIPSLYKRVHTDHSFRSVRLYLNRCLLQGLPSVLPLEYPADELLFTNYLAHHGLGAEVHGCGIIDAESGGHLFLGHSGAGKSTTTRLWETFANPEILSDDRIILRLHDGELWMYGTPWHGEAAFASPGKARLSRIFILQHGKKNAMKRLSPTQSVGEVFARCFPPFHSATGLERTLEFLSRALAVVPCYEFEFVPDRSAVETVRKFYD